MRWNIFRRWWIGGPPLLVCATLSAAGQLSVSELNYHDEQDPDLEFIELINQGTTPVTLTGAQFTSAITYTFGSPTLLAGNERIVIVRDRAKFISRYGTAGIRLADGAFMGRFADEGELVTLVDANQLTLVAFSYRPDGRWPSRPDGLGSTLECVDPAGNLDDPDNWRSSAEWHGSPGRAGVGPQRTVVINEILAHTDPPLEDAIELKNLTDQPVNIGGWYISNSRANPMKFRIPNGTVIEGGRFKVFYELAGTGDPAGFNPTGDGNSPSFTFSSAHGDEAVLLSADANGNPKLWMDAVTFEATANGISLGRYPDGAGKLTTLSQLTFGTEVNAAYPPEFITLFRQGLGASNAAPKVGPIVFRRIQYHPAAGEDEFLELQNNSDQTVSLYDPEHPENTWRLRDAVDFDFPGGVALESGARCLVVAIDPAQFRTRYSVPANIPVFGPWTNALSNGGERVALYQPDPPQIQPHPDAGFVPYVLVEEINYSPLPPWPTAPDGGGPALKRKDVSQFGNNPLAWEAENTVPPTPPHLGIAVLPQGVRLSFVAEPGRTYRLERTSSLGQGWNDQGLIPTPAPGGSVSVDVLLPGLFRVEAE
ncbi:MAG TPA: lamin tail domain-containing protein [Verrucomicrobiota bacterium]|nr:hypothetical protein [Verrucomicrobiales bacterium]HRI13619.1 lamin tail domain-containing protein [Verrucomicrobiota bacterium]